MIVVKIPSQGDVDIWVKKVVMDQIHQSFEELIHRLVKSSVDAAYDRKLQELRLDKARLDGVSVSDQDPIRVLKLTLRTKCALNNGDVQTVGDLCDMTEASLLKRRNIGIVTLKEIKSALESVGRAIK